MRRAGFPVLVALAFTAAAGWALPASTQLDASIFPRPRNLLPNIAFWSDIYGRYSSDQAVLHDDLHLDVVYGVVSFEGLELVDGADNQDLLRRRRERAETARDGIRDGLRALSQGRRKDIEAGVLQIILGAWTDGASTESLAKAAERVRYQVGLKDRFAEAVVISGRYLPGIEKVFAEEGVPLALSRLPFVESMFHTGARSKVGAVGAWQFMPGTARLYLPMSPAVDSRFDPILAAHGAAKMLRKDFDSLLAWPLAITAYNHGRGGVSRAVREVGSYDLGEIVARYRSRTFGFASRNFYSEFLAAHDVYENRAVLFPEAVGDPPLRYDEVRLGHYVSLLDIVVGSGVPVETLRELNPALDPEVFDATLLVPDDYPLRVPVGSGARVSSTVAGLDAKQRHSSQPMTLYRVRRGDTLSGIAGRFGTDPAAIVRLNQMSRPDRIFVGQAPRLPRGNSSSTARTVSTVQTREGMTHVVRRGETLISIAARYGRRVESLRQANRLRSADHIQIGQRLQIPSLTLASATGSEVHHLVRRGDTLSGIADRYGVTVAALQRHNGLDSSRIYSGQRLAIP